MEQENHYGSGAERGARVAALFCSLTESAQLVGSKPRTHVCEPAPRPIWNPATVTVPRDFN